MGEGLELLDVVYCGGRLLSLASLVYFLYLMFEMCKVLNVFSSETLHHLVRRAGNQDADPGPSGESVATRMR